MRKNTPLGLSAMIAGIAFSSVSADEPKVYIETDKSQYFQGELGTYTVVVDASSTGWQVTAVSTYENPLPDSFIQPLYGHDIFSSGSDTSGTYLEGFLTGEVVSGANQVYADGADILARTLSSDQPWPFEPHAKAITYQFGIRPDAVPGEYTISLRPPTKITHYTGSVPPFASTEVLPENLTPATFTVLQHNPADYDFDGDVDGLDGENFLGNWELRTQGADLDGSGEIDLRDYGVFQRCYKGSGVPSPASCVEDAQ